MRFTLTVDMDNDAFGGDSIERGDELARILRVVSERVSVRGVQPGDAGPARDSNGNTVARWEVLES